MAAVSCAIMAHPHRRAQVNQLIDALGVDVPVSWDTGKPGSHPEKRWANGVTAWRMYDPDADWHLVLQDDAVPCPDLLAGLSQALDHVPGPGPVSLYMGTKRPSPQRVKAMAERADAADAAWIGLAFLGWGVGFAVRTSDVDRMLDVAGVMTRQPYDTRIGRYFRDHARQPTWYTWPSLVDHRIGPSLVGHGGSGRIAFRHLRESALDVDWKSGVVVDDRAEILTTS